MKVEKASKQHQGEGKGKFPLKAWDNSLNFQFPYVLSCEAAFTTWYIMKDWNWNWKFKESFQSSLKIYSERADTLFCFFIYSYKTDAISTEISGNVCILTGNRSDARIVSVEKVKQSLMLRYNLQSLILRYILVASIRRGRTYIQKRKNLRPVQHFIHIFFSCWMGCSMKIWMLDEPYYLHLHDLIQHYYLTF